MPWLQISAKTDCTISLEMGSREGAIGAELLRSERVVTAWALNTTQQDKIRKR